MINIRTLFGLIFLLFSIGSWAYEGAYPMESADVDIDDLQSVRRGAGYFVDYCMGCHSIKHLRYSRIASDLKVSEEDLRRDIMAEGAKVHESLLSAMSSKDALEWFGVAPPDLSLIARSRGADWLYNYLKGFYADPAKATGVNNVMYEGVSMPNMFWELQGMQTPIFEKRGGAEVIVGLKQETPGKMTAQEFDQVMADVVNFLVYAAEPARYQRTSVGKYVVFALLILAWLFYRLKKEYWKDLE
jgi:ubiquinol-cytochrome c reductase cytochrome c1 subunit